MKYDAIVIGSGIGGLSCAASLAFSNQKVLVLEQYDQVGGYLTCLSHENWQWLRGFQYTGSILPDNKDFALLEYLSDNQVVLKKLSNEFQRIKSPEYEFSIYSDVNIMKSKLIAEFPQEKEAIEKYLNQVVEIGSLFAKTFFMKRTWRPLSVGLMEVADFIIHCLRSLSHVFKFRIDQLSTLKEVIDNTFKNPKLKLISHSSPIFKRVYKK